MRNAFFLRSAHDRRVAGRAGDMIIDAWDHIFEDNFGAYRLDALLKRGTGKAPVIE